MHTYLRDDQQHVPPQLVVGVLQAHAVALKENLIRALRVRLTGRASPAACGPIDAAQGGGGCGSGCIPSFVGGVTRETLVTNGIAPHPDLEELVFAKLAHLKPRETTAKGLSGMGRRWAGIYRHTTSSIYL